MPNKIDWSQYEVKEDQNNSDNEPFPIPEPTGIGGVYSDLLSSALAAKDFAGNIPDQLEKSGKYIEENPGKSILHNAGQAVAETGSIAKGIVNAPYNLNQYLARKHLLPQVLGKIGKLIPHLPEDTGVEKALGLEADPEKGDNLVRAIPNIAALASGGIGIGKKILKTPDLKQVIRDTQAKVNKATEATGKVFEKVQKEVGSRGLDNVPINKDVIKRAKTFLAKTPANSALIKKAKTGDYQALRDLQADLRIKGEQALSSTLAAEKTRAEEIFDTRDQVNKSIERHLDRNGHKDLSELLNKARKDYAEIKQTYFSTPALAKVFGKSQKVPAKPKALLAEESTEMNKFMSAHPEVKKALSKALSHEKKMKNLGKVGAALGIGTAAEGVRRVLGGK